MSKPRLFFTLISKTRDLFGVWEVCIQIGYVEYTYTISSSYAVEQFDKYLRKRRYGLALNVLKKFKTSILKKDLPVPFSIKETERALFKSRLCVIKALRILGKSYLSSNDRFDLVELQLTEALDALQKVKKGETNDAAN